MLFKGEKGKPGLRTLITITSMTLVMFPPHVLGPKYERRWRPRNSEEFRVGKSQGNLSDEVPLESLEDSGYDGKYQPTYEYDDDGSADAEGQDESDGLEAVLQAERAYFIARDHDGDGELSKLEFTRQLNEVDPDDKEEWDTWNTSQRGRPAPSKAELMWGKDWTARVTADQVLECG